MLGELTRAARGYWEIRRSTKKWVKHQSGVEQDRTPKIIAVARFMVQRLRSLPSITEVDRAALASGGTGVLPQGELHPDLVNRLAQEAAKAAGHVLNMCFRALDYCPPVDLTFGEYLRALITADLDLMPEDEHRYRVAFIEAFRRRGLYPRDVRTLRKTACGGPARRGSHACAR